MRLLRLNEYGVLSLVERIGREIPPYAILSHTWGKDDEEPTFRDLIAGTGMDKIGYRKLVFCQKQAARDGLDFFWVDTCCIDKSSSSELQEAINSMFLWYRRATKCYVYLSDVSTTRSGSVNSFETSRWFTRGWTLQELLSPASVEFFSAEGILIGDKISLVQRVANITGISVEALQGKNLAEFGVTERMRWAGKRETKREEDVAYALLGIFNVHMPLIYGEGKENALKRLQREIKESVNVNSTSRLEEADSFKHNQDMIDKIHKWLSAPDPSTNYQRAQTQRQAGTGLWLVESEEFQRWKMDAASRLWLYGIPGCGKTVLSSVILKNLMREYHDDPKTVTLYFYFDFNDTNKRDSGMMLRSIMNQISQHSVEGLKHLSAVFSSCGDGQRQPSTSALVHALEKMVREFEHTYLVLDALDECTQRSELMSILETIAGWQPMNLHMLMFSRKERDIESSLRRYIGEKDIFCLQSDVVDQDIQQYVRRRLFSDKSLSKWEKDSALRHEIETALMRGACGMFRWAACQLDTLGTCRNRAMLRQTLSTLPATLDQTYDRILTAISEDDSVYAFRILQWLTFSARPLSLEEIAEAVAIDPERDPAFDQDEILEDPLEALDICSSLITITPESRAVKRGDARRIVALAHYSVQEYLLSSRITQSKASRYSMDYSSGHDAIATSCLNYLLQIQQPETYPEELMQASRLAMYSAEFWISHAQKAGMLIEKVSQAAVNLFSKENPAYGTWIRLYDLDAPWRGSDFRRTMETMPPPLYYAAYAGMDKLVEILLDQGADVNAKGGMHGNALQAASCRGHGQIVKLLLNRGADTNAHGGEYGNAIIAASYCGHESIVKLLLNHNADVDANFGETHSNALFMASNQGHEKVVKLLLDHNADTRGPREELETPLQTASLRGYEIIVEMLLDKGADVNEQGGGDFGSALQAACWNDHKQIAELLIDRGADINSQGGTYNNALQVASFRGHKQTVKLLLKHGADVNAYSKSRYPHALFAATCADHDQVVKLLLENGAKDDRQDGRDGAALRAACNTGNVKIVRLLLGHQQGIIGYYEGGWTALDIAADKKHFEVIKLLLENGAYTATKGMNSRYGTVPNLLAALGSTDLLQFSKEHLHADLSLPEPCGRTPLLLAAKGGHIDTCSYLIGQGLDPAIVDRKGDGLLCYAALSGSLEMIDAVLRTTQVSCSLLGSFHWTPLHWACRAGHFEIVEQLVKAGVDGRRVAVPHPKGEWSPLDIAVFHGHRARLRYLTPACRSVLGVDSPRPGLREKSYAQALCDGCINDIYGPRFHCLTCPDFDYCFMCKPFLDNLHEGHEWEVIEAE